MEIGRSTTASNGPCHSPWRTHVLPAVLEALMHHIATGNLALKHVNFRQCGESLDANELAATAAELAQGQTRHRALSATPVDLARFGLPPREGIEVMRIEAGDDTPSDDAGLRMAVVTDLVHEAWRRRPGMSLGEFITSIAPEVASPPAAPGLAGVDDATLAARLQDVLERPVRG